MFLTRMALDMTRRDTVELVASPARLNLAIRSAFAGGNLQPLFRLDDIGTRKWVVVLSMLRPSLHAMHERYGYLGVFPSWETFDYDETLEEAQNGTTWRFELCASPQGPVPEADIAWLDETRLIRWLRAQGDSCGFEAGNLHLMHREWLDLDDEGWLLLTRWRGSLRVTHDELFRRASVTGIGSGQDWGSGLMTLSRAATWWAD